jgi:hypothetical protein
MPKSKDLTWSIDVPVSPDDPQSPYLQWALSPADAGSSAVLSAKFGDVLAPRTPWLARDPDRIGRRGTQMVRDPARLFCHKRHSHRTRLRHWPQNRKSRRQAADCRTPMTA